VASGCPPVERYSFDFGPVTIAGSPAPVDGVARAYCPRRTILDKLLVDAAAAAGAEIREAFTVEEIVFEEGRVVGVRGRSSTGARVTEHAKVVIGADGWHSVIADAVQPERYHEKPALLAAYYSYWSGLPMDGRFEIYIRPDCGFGATATHDGLTLIIGGWPYAEYDEKKRDIDGHFLKMIDLVPAFAERLQKARREARYLGAALPNYFRKPYGPGWVLVGDAGYIKDSITAQGWGGAAGYVKLVVAGFAANGIKINPIPAVLRSKAIASFGWLFKANATARLYISRGWFGRNSAASFMFSRKAA